ncbi:hypothetical protein GCM10007918_11660 [Piscinibacter gummiphilus]|nr:hypothetical protein GCM10007918_11660 [Piscinibacter gummiphilus]
MRNSLALRRAFILGALVVSMIIVFSPWLLYGIGLHGVLGKPQLPDRIATDVEQMEIWRASRGVGRPEVYRLNPYTYLASPAGVNARAGILVAWQVAARHLQENRRYRGMHWWHLSGAALTVWLTRNWSMEQMLSKLAEGKATNAA